jgi:hypothetical protein
MSDGPVRRFFWRAVDRCPRKIQMSVSSQFKNVSAAWVERRADAELQRLTLCVDAKWCYASHSRSRN